MAVRDKHTHIRLSIDAVAPLDSYGRSTQSGVVSVLSWTDVELDDKRSTITSSLHSPCPLTVCT